MPILQLADLTAEQAWRLGRTFTDIAAYERNRDRLDRLQQLIPTANAGQVTVASLSLTDREDELEWRRARSLTAPQWPPNSQRMRELEQEIADTRAGRQPGNGQSSGGGSSASGVALAIVFAILALFWLIIST